MKRRFYTGHDGCIYVAEYNYESGEWTHTRLSFE